MKTLSPLASRLAELPEFDPPAHLWARIDAAVVARKRRRTWGAAAAGGAIAASVAFALLLVRPVTTPAPDALVSLRSESQHLESQLASTTLVHSSATLSTEMELQRVESALQFAYDHGADTQELAPLWRRRVDLLAVLLQLQQPDQQLSQI
jgi:hypothetical protein